LLSAITSSSFSFQSCQTICIGSRPVIINEYESSFRLKKTLFSLIGLISDFVAFLFLLIIEFLLSIAGKIKPIVRYSYIESAAYSHFLNDSFDLILRHRHLNSLFGKTFFRPLLIINDSKCSFPPLISSLRRHFTVILLSELPLPNILKSAFHNQLFFRSPVDYDFKISTSDCVGLSNSSIFIPSLRFVSSRNIFGLWQYSKLTPHDVLTNEEERECAEFLRSKNIDTNNFIATHIRTPAWYVNHNSEFSGMERSELDSVRNLSQIEDFEPGIMNLLTRGFSVVQMGRFHKRLNISHENFIYLDDWPDRPEKIDLYILAHLSGMVGTGSGPDCISIFFNDAPFCYINQFPHLYALSYMPAMYLLPSLRYKNSGEMVTLGGYINYNLCSLADLEQQGIEVEGASRDQITQTICFFADYYVLREQIPNLSSWKQFNSKYVNTLALYHSHYFSESSLSKSIYSQLDPVAASQKWHYFIDRRYSLAPSFVDQLDDSWLDIRF